MAIYDHHNPDYQEIEDCMVNGMDANDWAFEQSLRNLKN